MSYMKNTNNLKGNQIKKIIIKQNKNILNVMQMQNFLNTWKST